MTESFTWVARGPGVVTVGVHRVEALPGGRSRVTAVLEQGGLLAPALGLLTKGLARTYMQTELLGLKAHCER